MTRFLQFMTGVCLPDRWKVFGTYKRISLTISRARAHEEQSSDARAILHHGKATVFIPGAGT